MRRLFQWIKQRREAQLYDMSGDNWAPVGPTDTNIDWSSWLAEEAPKAQVRVRARPLPQPMVREASPPGESRVEASAPRAAVMPMSAHQQQPTENQARPRIHTSPPSEGQWVEVLKSYGEHLTEEELLIIRRQLVAR